MRRISEIPSEEIIEALKASETFREAIQRLGYYGQGGAYRTFRKRIEKEGLDYSHMKHYRSNPQTRDPLTIFVEDSEVSSNTLRRAVFTYTNIPYVCALCGQPPEWHDKPLTLTLDHINGNHRDNRIENLRFVCPNCDRQLDTFGSKNNYSYYKDPVHINKGCKGLPRKVYSCIKCGVPVWNKNSLCRECLINENRKNFPSKDELDKAIIDCPTLVALGKYFNVSDNAMRKRLKYYGISGKSKEYRRYREELINNSTV